MLIFSVTRRKAADADLHSFSHLSSPWVQIMLLTDPEVESSLLISSDEGATYQKYRLNFYILSLLFHPEQEDWILAYSHDQKVRKHTGHGVGQASVQSDHQQSSGGCCASEH